MLRSDQIHTTASHTPQGHTHAITSHTPHRSHSTAQSQMPAVLLEWSSTKGEQRNNFQTMNSSVQLRWDGLWKTSILQVNIFGNDFRFFFILFVILNLILSFLSF